MKYIYKFELFGRHKIPAFDKMLKEVNETYKSWTGDNADIKYTAKLANPEISGSMPLTPEEIEKARKLFQDEAEKHFSDVIVNYIGSQEIHEPVLKKKVSVEKFLSAYSFLRELNKEKITQLDLSDFFEGKPEDLERAVNEFTLCGLNNADFITSDFAAKYNLKRKFKLGSK